MKYYLLVLVILMISSCGNVKQIASNTPRLITVNGIGSATSVPDVFNFSVIIEEKGKLAHALSAVVNDKTQQVVNLLTQLKVEEKNIQSLQVQLNPWIEFNGQSQQQKGFVLTRKISVALHNLKQYDQAIDGLMNLNVARIEGFNFTSSHAQQDYQQALQNALMNAKSSANNMAEILQLKLGRVVSINESSQGQAQPVLRARTMQFKESSDSLAGEMTTEAQVNVVFELTDN